MLGLNWVDLVIIALLSWAVIIGVGVGLVTEFLVVTGFFATLFLAGWLFPHLLPIHDTTAKTVVNAVLVLLVSAYAATRCFDLGQNVHWSFQFGKFQGRRNLRWFEMALGAIPGLVAGLTLTWLAGVAVIRLPFVGFSNSTNSSWIVQHLVRALPPVPAVFAWFDRKIDPNSQPYVFAQPKPQTGFDYSSAAVAAASARAAPSVVRITSYGCGGLVSGTGFAIGPQLIATNAHVIAGIKRAVVKYKNVSYESYPVLFDPVLDMAVLRVQGLALPPLALAADDVSLGMTVAVLGYPGGNYSAGPGIIRDTRAVSATTIYNQGSFGRGVYEVQTHLDYGNSGGPIVLGDGKVAGMIFSKSLTVPNYGFALTSSHLEDALHQTQDSRRRVGTGACMVQ